MISKRMGELRFLVDMSGSVMRVRRVLVVPEASSNLLATTTLDDDGFTVIHGGGKTTIKRGKRLVMEGDKKGKGEMYGLYFVKAAAPQDQARSFQAVVDQGPHLPRNASKQAVSLLAKTYTGKLTPYEVAHSRLGHQCKKVVKRTYPHLKIEQECSWAGSPRKFVCYWSDVE